MLKELKDVLWRGKADFSIGELERQKELCNSIFLVAVLVDCWIFISVLVIQYTINPRFADIIVHSIVMAVIVMIIMIGYAFVARGRLCEKMIAYKYTEKKKKAVLYFIKKQELNSLKLVDDALKGYLYKTSTEQERVHFESILTEENTVAIKVNGRIIENIYTWEDRLLDFFDPIIEDGILRGFF